MIEVELQNAKRAFLGMSHSPLLGLNPVSEEDQNALDCAVEQARAAVHAFDPELIILIGPDHYNGFFNDLMPTFCVGSEVTAVGDYLSPAGPLNVPSDTAVALAEHLMDAHFDMAVSRRMLVDHGFSQALQVLWGDDLKTPPVIPIFLNAVAQPTIARMSRCVELGQAIGNHWLLEDGLKAGERVVVDGLQRVRPGIAVKPVAAGQGAAAKASAPAPAASAVAPASPASPAAPAPAASRASATE